MLTVFLSSTSKDIEQCREAAFRAIEGLHGYHCVRMEDFGSIDEAPDDFCRTKLGECDLFVCIAGPLYGSRSPEGNGGACARLGLLMALKRTAVTRAEGPLTEAVLKHEAWVRCAQPQSMTHKRDQ
jgi:Domain of unknown function (DUF4062)